MDVRVIKKFVTTVAVSIATFGLFFCLAYASEEYTGSPLPFLALMGLYMVGSFAWSYAEMQVARERRQEEKLAEALKGK